jgi:uncharacterized protein
MNKSWLQHAIVFLIAVVGPIWDRFALRHLKANPTTRAKLSFYRHGVAVQWILSALIYVLIGRSIFWAPAAFAWMHSVWSTIVGIAFIAGFAFALVSPFMALRKPKARAAIRKAFQKFEFFLPTRSGEFGWFGAACITAGICEEWLTRGFLFRYFGQTPWHWGLLAAFVAATLIFGVNHIYQGWTGALSATFIGAVMGLLYLWTGNLLVSMVAHALIDLRALFLLKAVHTEAPA